MRMGLRTVCGANLRSLSGVLRPRDTIDREAASVASVFAGRMTTAMSCAHRHLSRLSLHFILIASFMHHYYLLRHTTNTPKYPCLWRFMHLIVYLASAFFVLPLVDTLQMRMVVLYHFHLQFQHLLHTFGFIDTTWLLGTA